MAIDFDKYVRIISAVGGVAQGTARELILRLMTQDEQLPTGSVVELTSLEAVGAFFGTTSPEFDQAQFYFAFISKLSTSASKISFARFALIDTAPQIFGETNTAFNVSDFDTISDAEFRITLGGITEDISVDFTSPLVGSLTAVATAVQDAIQAANVAAVYAGCLVAFDATASRFEFTGGDTGAFVISAVTTGTGTDLLPIIKWEEPGARFSDGIVGQTITEFLIDQAAVSNNFGSFSFIPALTNDQVVESATWNDGENVKYMYLQKTSSSNAATLQALVKDLSGTGLTLADLTVNDDFPWLLPGAIMAATPYATQRAAVQNYMFQQANLDALVTDTTLSDTFDAIFINYYGATQQAGQALAFYQRGFLQGLPTAPLDMGVYANEVFLKDAVGVAIINLFLALSAIPANSSGEAQVLGAIQEPIDRSLFNGVISVGKTLNATQRAFVTVVTNDTTAFLQIENSGYWIDTAIIEAPPNEFTVFYTLLYSKNDVVRKVEGSHILI